MSNNNGNYSAFPVTYDPTGMRTPSTTADGEPVMDDGMSIRQYAAIHLRVPRSGHAWLDEMIREAQRNEFAARALVSLAPIEVPWASTARSCRAAADAMMAELNKTTTT